MTKPFVVSETELVEKMKTFLDECDSDELGRIAEEIFGVEFVGIELDEQVFNMEEYYAFVPTENYCGAFDCGDAEIDGPSPWLEEEQE